MGNANRTATSNLESFDTKILQDYSFFQLVEFLGKAYSVDLEQMDRVLLSDSLFRFSSHAGLGFPASEVSKVDCQVSNRYPVQYGIEVNFLGLHGASSPLPGRYLEEVAYDYAQESGVRHLFLDFFNHRLNVLLHKIWRKYRYYTQFKPNAEDVFSQKVFAFIGLSDEEFREKATIEAQTDSSATEESINWSKLMSFAGLIASRSRSPSIVEGIIAHYFNLEDVNIIEWERRLVEVPDDQKNSMGVKNCTLGEDFLIGTNVETRVNKFVIELTKLDRKTFNEFLPTGESFKALKTLIAFLLREQMTYDLRLGLLQKELPPFELKREQNILLGWNSFLGKSPLLRESSVSIGVVL